LKVVTGRENPIESLGMTHAAMGFRPDLRALLPDAGGVLSDSGKPPSAAGQPPSPASSFAARSRLRPASCAKLESKPSVSPITLPL
jgi:hypothetical protein